MWRTKWVDLIIIICDKLEITQLDDDEFGFIHKPFKTTSDVLYLFKGSFNTKRIKNLISYYYDTSSNYKSVGYYNQEKVFEIDEVDINKIGEVSYDIAYEAFINLINKPPDVYLSDTQIMLTNWFIKPYMKGLERGCNVIFRFTGG